MDSLIDTPTANTAMKLSDLSISNDNNNEDDEMTNIAMNANDNSNINNHVTTNTNATIDNDSLNNDDTCALSNKDVYDNKNGTSDRTKNKNAEEEEEERIPGIRFVDYRDESDLETVMRLVGRDLSEPYSSESFFCFFHSLRNLLLWLWN